MMARGVVKIGIVGMGHVGPHAASFLIQRGSVDELFLADVAENEAKVRAEAFDLFDSSVFAPRHVLVHNVHDDYEQLAQCDVIINAAGHVKMSAESRDGELFATIASARRSSGASPPPASRGSGWTSRTPTTCSPARSTACPVCPPAT
jgi:L-lactate dehydrogenase